jgi:Arc/MetJ-type ribon-helix-helix transcriptional regulator
VNVRSRVSLSGEEIALIERLRRRMDAKTNAAVVRRALRLLEETTDPDALRRAYERASLATRASLGSELAELDHLAGEGVED